MTDGVKFIFKTLIKVPVFIAVSFFIFNIFAFCLTYFRALGISYVVQQTAVENNWLPGEELKILCKYVDSELEKSAVVQNAKVIIGTSTGSDGSATYATAAYNESTNKVDIKLNGIAKKDTAAKKKQYGSVVTVGVTCDFTWVWPLDYRQNGMSGGDSQRNVDTSRKTSDFDDDKSVIENTVLTEDNNITILYTVPGLKYYPDMTH